MSKLRRLRQLWARIPQIECKGLCWDSCGPIRASVLEEALLEQESGVPLGTRIHPLASAAYPDAEDTSMCCHLTAGGRCSVYAVRPTICRLWGVVEGLPCHHGCEPVGGRLPDTEGMALLALSMRIGGDRQVGSEAIDALLEAIERGDLTVETRHQPDGRTSLTLLPRKPS